MNTGQAILQKMRTLPTDKPQEVVELVEFLQQQGKKDHAQHMLTNIYGRFTEGFGTADLQEAQIAMKELV